MATYFDSLKRNAALPVTALFPAHGPVMANAKAKIQNYLESSDGARIQEYWLHGRRTIEQSSAIVKQVYTDVSPALQWVPSVRSLRIWRN